MFRAFFLTLLLAAVPSSTNYTLKTYNLGQGANAGSSTNYGLRGTAGGANGVLGGTAYGLPAGIQASTTAPQPGAPALNNPAGAYNTLHLVLNTGSFAADTKYLIAISTDNFATTNYIQPDDTVGAGAGIAGYQTYAAWGGAGGFDILSLNPSTTYAVKVAALQGNDTGSAFGPTASAATQAPTATFTLQTSLTGTPPFSTGFASLPAGQVTAGSATVTATVTSNAAHGGSMTINDQNSGLTSSTRGYTLASASADLSAAASGYGAQVTGTSQSSGGPLAAASPYNGGGNSVGGLGSARTSFASWSNPVNSGSATLSLLAKSSSLTPASPDYADIITISLSLIF